MTLLTQIQIRRDTAANWTTANPVLAIGEMGIETDTGHARVGDGTTAWSSLTSAFKRVNQRTLPQLAAAPTSADIACGPGALFTSTDNILRYINATGSAFVAIDVVAMQAATATAASSATAAVSTAGSAQTAAAAAVTTANAASTAASAAQSAASNAIPLTQKAAANGVATLDGSSLLPATQLPNPTSSTLGGVKSAAGTAHQFVTGISTLGVPVTARPVVADLSDANTLELMVGVYGSTSSLQAAFPAASNAGFTALVGSSAPFGVYKSDGTTWNKEVSPTDLNAKQNVPVSWNGTTPALVSSTNPLPSFGSNAFVYTGAGGAVLDGQTYQTGDEAVWNGTTFTCVRLGGGFVGTYASTAALQTAYPAASNPACIALVAGVIYISNGTAWQIKVQASTDLSDASVLTTQSTNAQSGTTYTLVLADAGQNVDMSNASANTLTVPPNSSVAFPIGTLITVTMAGAGITTIAPGAGVTFVKPAARTLAISAQYETAQLFKTATDTWRVLAG